MARTHGANDTATAFGADKVRPNDSDARPAPAVAEALRRTDALRVTFLGINAWAVLVLIPALTSNERSHLVMLALPLVAIGLVALAIRRASTGAPAAVLILFPGALTATIATVPRLRHGDAFSAPMLVFGVLSFAMYGVAGAYAMGRRSALRKTSEHPLGQRAMPDASRGRQTWLRRGLIAAGGIFAIAVIAVAPFLGTRRSLDDAWRGAAAEGSVLTTVVAASLATLVIAVFIGPALRSAKRNVRETRHRSRRVTALLLLVAIGISSYVLYLRGMN